MWAPHPRAARIILLAVAALRCSAAEPPVGPHLDGPVSKSDASAADAPSAEARGTPLDGPADAPGSNPAPDCHDPPCINVSNRCPIPLWIHPVGTVPLDGGNVRRLDPGKVWQYANLPAFGGGRLYAYYEEPLNKQDPNRLVSDMNQFVEMTIDRDMVTGAWAQNYNISYVDYASLPVFMKASGACAATSCALRFDDWLGALHGCPTDLRNTYQGISTCTGSFGYCVTPDGTASYDTTRAYCSKMQAAHGFTGSAVYGGYFPDHPATEVAFWDGVAAWNRGTTAGDADDAHYFVTEPYNAYARWIHKDLGCSNVYAFSTDDHQDKAGFVRCVSDSLDIVWCPNG